MSEPNIRFIELFSFRAIYLLQIGGIRSPNFLIRNRQVASIPLISESILSKRSRYWGKKRPFCLSLCQYVAFPLILDHSVPSWKGFPLSADLSR